jgi:mono/diheme cytochrome c family protein
MPAKIRAPRQNRFPSGESYSLLLGRQVFLIIHSDFPFLGEDGMRLRVPATVLVVLILVACGGVDSPQAQDDTETGAAVSASENEVPMPFQLSAALEEGKVVYETMCWACHGSAGRGDGPAVQAGTVAPPRDFTTGAFSGITATQFQADFRAEVGALNSDHPHMQNVLSMVDIQAFASALAYIPALTYPPEIPGSAIAGRENYILRCQGCHGATGLGNGAGAEVLELSPANFQQDTLLAFRNFEGAFQKIRAGGGGVHGSSMPAWGVMLTDGAVWDLVAFISSFQSGILSPPPGGLE